MTAHHILMCTGCHATPSIGKGMREYLQHEWDRKVSSLLACTCSWSLSQA